MAYRRFRRSMLNGHPGNISLACKRFIVRAVNAGLVVTSTTGGRHAPGSYHKPRWFPGARGRAVDVGLKASEVGTRAGRRKLERFQRREYMQRRRRYNELLGPLNHANVKLGAPWRLSEGQALEDAHDDHVHAAPRW